MWHLAVLFCLTAVVYVNSQSCPSDDPLLTPWLPVVNETEDIVIDGQQLLLSVNFLRVHSITIQNGGRLVVSDRIGDVRIEFKYMLIQYDGEFHVGSETCRFLPNLEIMLYGRSDDTDVPNHPSFGKKFIGITPTGTISIHGQNKLAWTYLTTTLVQGNNNEILDVADDVTSWTEQDRIVIASSDYDMNNAEEFDLQSCPTSQCSARQIQISGNAEHTHLGTYTIQGVDMRAEVGLLTRNIKIFGEMQPQCYGSNFCQFFDYDTFGGHIQLLSGFKRAEFEGIELYHMGQQFLGRYPVHYHLTGKVYGSFVRQLSIHNCFSRCVTLHGCEGLTVQDVVGYNTLGHCFFLEDGNEQNNQLIRNLGLVTKPGTLLPSDRDKAMCEGLLGAIQPGYVPNAEKECMEVATFWIAHPNNTIRNNSAAGSVNNGFHYVFHREPTGPSVGTLPPYHGERSHIPIFSGNKAHSNADTGLLLDRGVKIEASSPSDPREFLAMSDYARYMPHQNHDLLQPRYPSQIMELTAYKNSNGAIVRGGDVYIQRAKFSDNDVGVILLSDGLLPDDAGCHQELVDSVVAATADNNNIEWQQRSHPSVGIQMLSGPLLVDNNYFYGYTPTGGREAYAIGFYPQYAGQFCTINTIGYNTAGETTHRVYFGRNETGSIYGEYDEDGDKNQVFYDRDGIVTSWIGAYALRRDNLLLRGDNCQENSNANAAICIGNNYGQLFVNATTKTASMTISNQYSPYNPTVLRGANKNDLTRYPTTTQYQSAVVVGRNYQIEFNEATPNWIQVSTHHFPQNSQIKLAIDFNSSAATTFTLTYYEWKQMADLILRVQTMVAGSSIQDVDNDTAGLTYYFDPTARLLHVKLMNRYAKYGYDFCAEEGCQIVRVESS